MGGYHRPITQAELRYTHCETLRVVVYLCLAGREDRAVWNNRFQNGILRQITIGCARGDLEARHGRRELGRPGYCEIRNETLP